MKVLLFINSVLIFSFLMNCSGQKVKEEPKLFSYTHSSDDTLKSEIVLSPDSSGINILIKNTSDKYMYIPDIRPLEVYLKIVEVDGTIVDNDWLFNNRYYTARISDSTKYDLVPSEFLNALNEFVSKWITSKDDKLSEFEKTNLRNYSNLAKVSYLLIPPFQECKEFVSLSPPLPENSKYWIYFNYDPRKLGIVKLLDSIHFELPQQLGRYMKVQENVTQDSILFSN